MFIIYWFGAQETFPIIVNDNSIHMETLTIF